MCDHALTDAQWTALAPHLPPHPAGQGRPAKDHRLVVEAIIWRLRTGGPCGRDLAVESLYADRRRDPAGP